VVLGKCPRTQLCQALSLIAEEPETQPTEQPILESFNEIAIETQTEPISEPIITFEPIPEEEPLLVMEPDEPQLPEPDEEFDFAGLIEPVAEEPTPMPGLDTVPPLELPKPELPAVESLPAPEPDPVPVESIPIPDKPKPIVNATTGYVNWQNRQEAQTGSSGLAKTFKLLMWFSLVVILFILIKYVAFGQRYRFTKVADSLQVEIPQAAPEESNLPIDMVSVPSDTLVMGSIAPEADDDEFPLLTMKIPAFLISKTEVTQKQWLMVFPENPSKNIGLDLPVDNISFYEAIEFCNAKKPKRRPYTMLRLL